MDSRVNLEFYERADRVLTELLVLDRSGLIVPELRSVLKDLLKKLIDTGVFKRRKRKNPSVTFVIVHKVKMRARREAKGNVRNPV